MLKRSTIAGGIFAVFAMCAVSFALGAYTAGLSNGHQSLESSVCANVEPDHSDLCAQWVAAGAGVSSAFWAMAGVIITAFAAIGVVFQIRHAQSALETSERAWIGFSIRATGPINWLPDRGDLPVAITLSNAGKTPAINVFAWASFSPSLSQVATEAAFSRFVTNLGQDETPMSQIVMPGSPSGVFGWGVPIRRNQLLPSLPHASVMGCIFVAVRYRTIFGGDFKVTAQAYQLMRNGNQVLLADVAAPANEITFTPNWARNGNHLT